MAESLQDGSAKDSQCDSHLTKQQSYTVPFRSACASESHKDSCLLKKKLLQENF